MMEAVPATRTEQLADLADGADLDALAEEASLQPASELVEEALGLLAAPTDDIEPVSAEHLGDPFDIVFDHAPLAMLICTDEAQVERVNQAFCTLMNQVESALVGRAFEDLVHPEDRDLVAPSARRTDRPGGAVVARRLVRSDDSVVLLRCTESALPGIDGGSARRLLQMENLESTEARSGRSHSGGLTDTLTGLMSQDGLREYMDQAFADSIPDTATVMVIDLDHFKDVNFVHGPTVGDELLFEVARRLEVAVREGDRCARPGDDEFIVVCQDVASFVDAYRVADRIRRSIAEPFELSVGTVSTTASIGIASGWPAATAEDVIGCADGGRHHAKYLGRNRVEHGR